MIVLQSFEARFAPQELLINPTDVKQAQKDRESVWPMGLMLDTGFIVGGVYFLDVDLWQGAFWWCLFIMVLAHAFIVEPIYYIFHRILHMRWFYEHHHIFHHRSVRVEPITSMSFTLAERFSYTLLFSIPTFAVFLLGVFNFWAVLVFYLIFDLLNSLGHLNLKITPRWYHRSWIRWIIYTPEYHEKHHSRIITNYALSMPIYDKLFGTLTEEHKE